MSREVSAGVMAPSSRKGVDRPGCGLLLVMVAAAWVVEGADRVLPGDLENLGIRPRRVDGLIGVILSPWLHGGWEHLIANTLAFLGLGMVVLMAEGRRFIGTTMVLVVVSGLGTWVIGRPAVHIGASGLIYGYFGYILGRAIWERRASWVLIGLVVGIIYGGMLWGVLPTRSFVSWEAHLAGLVAGIWLGRAHASVRRSRPRPV